MKIKRRSPEPFFFEGGKTGILLIHGFTGTPSELSPLGRFLHKQGYTVHAPLLAGHGTTPEDMNTTTWPDWWKSTQEGYQRLKESGVEEVIAIGLSMGGCLVLNLARTESLSGVVPLCAPIWLKDKRAHLTGLFQYWMPYRKRGGDKPAHIEDYLVAYDRTPLKCIVSLRKFIRYLRPRLSKVTVPALVVQAEKDETVVPKSASYIFEAIESEDKDIRWFAKSGHIITVDKERERLFTEIDTFVKRVTGSNQSPEAL
ncbi:carboxylesterase [Marininema mesophilum]|uniref:Carboxylesterase n=1 Tax=Marininema mesophilum TaxID=1048340 RepID=A0A1H2TT18_9BACL|nr:alpha/beta fold hydrolase [Marininema mesophilum]SDW46888.1 carboxylesterase [Marininema mesophilum]